jgi:Zn-finger nucleic acid-binding protein
MSLFRDQFTYCPRCRATLETAGEKVLCRSCRGMWVPEATLVEMFRDMHGGFVPRGSLFPRQGEPLPCPGCNEAMKPMTLETVAVDYCERHGLWFDDQELGWALLHSYLQK